MTSIRLCGDHERAAILAIVNAAAEAYRGVIPADRWREPYMPQDELDGEIDAGVAFWGYEADGALVGIMGIQPVRDVDLIRHAYVSPGSQRRGIGGALLEHFARSTTRRMLVGTWAAADWAISFYRRHGFELVSPERKATLLKDYWTIPDRQIETSVVLAKPPLDNAPVHQTTTLGAEFAHALAAKDSARMLDLMHPEIDFRGLTPNRSWEANDPEAVIAALLGEWFEEADEIEALERLEDDAFADRERVGYRFSVSNPDGRFLVEQQAYLSHRDGRIEWMRVLCSGYRPAKSPD